MVMHWISQEWIAQWLGVRDRLRRQDPEADAWWLGIRERILRFLVSRYVDSPEEQAEVKPLPRVRAPLPMEQRRTYCRVRPEEHPPRRCADMTGKLRSVSRINASKRRRWRLL
jgi:hypothetical protein